MFGKVLIENSPHKMLRDNMNEQGAMRKSTQERAQKP
jgi:hypothetical protein